MILFPGGPKLSGIGADCYCLVKDHCRSETEVMLTGKVGKLEGTMFSSIFLPSEKAGKFQPRTHIVWNFPGSHLKT